MEYIKIELPVSGQEQSDLLTALLADVGYDGFEETGNSLLAYIGKDEYDESVLADVAGVAATTFSSEVVPQQNWNALWESNFPPVVVEDFCTVFAHFHDIDISTPYKIKITPKMSFGTGHHATTQLMMLAMADIGFGNKKVLDFGTGTGVLAILAEMLGADEVLAIDNDSWCVENAAENLVQNGCVNIKVRQSSMDEVALPTDVILANINRHILLQYMNELYACLNDGGTILMSGLLTEDKEIMLKEAREAGFRYVSDANKGNWLLLKFTK